MNIDKSIYEKRASAFGEHLKTLRQSQNLTQRNVADKLGCSESTYANWEQGRTEPSIRDMYALLALFDIDANELFDL